MPAPLTALPCSYKRLTEGPIPCIAQRGLKVRHMTPSIVDARRLQLSRQMRPEGSSRGQPAHALCADNRRLKQPAVTDSYPRA